MITKNQLDEDSKESIKQMIRDKEKELEEITETLQGSTSYIRTNDPIFERAH